MYSDAFDGFDWNHNAWYGLTALWILVLAVVIIASWKVEHRSNPETAARWWQPTYAVVLYVVAAASVLLFTFAVISCLAALDGRMWDNAKVSSFGVNVLIFWALFPPCWFFSERYAVDCGFFRPPDWPRGHSEPARKEARMQSMAGYQDSAMKIWAAVLVVLGLAFAQVGSIGVSQSPTTRAPEAERGSAETGPPQAAEPPPDG